MQSYGDEKESDRRQREEDNASFVLARQLQEQEDKAAATALQGRSARSSRQEEKKQHSAQIAADEAIARLEQQEEDRKRASSNSRYQPRPVQELDEEGEIKEVNPTGKTSFEFFKQSFNHPKHTLSSHYDVIQYKNHDNLVIVQEKKGNAAPNEHTQKRFTAFLNTIAGKYVAAFNGDPTPQWIFFRLPEKKFDFTAPFKKLFQNNPNPQKQIEDGLKQKKIRDEFILYKLIDFLPLQLQTYIKEVKEIQAELYMFGASEIEQAEIKMGDELLNNLSAAWFDIPVRIPGFNNREPYDLVDILRNFPNREGKRMCPFRTEASNKESFFLLVQIQPAPDILEKIKYRNMALGNPIRLFDLLLEQDINDSYEIIDHLNFACMIDLLTACQEHIKKNISNPRASLVVCYLLRQLFVEAEKPLHEWEENEKIIFFQSLNHLSQTKQVSIIIDAFIIDKNIGIIFGLEEPPQGIALLENLDFGSFRDALNLKKELDQNLGAFTLKLVRATEKEQKNTLRLLHLKDKQKIFDYINNNLGEENVKPNQFDSLIGVMLTEHATDENVDHSALIAAFFKYIDPEKQEALLLKKVSNSPAKCMVFINTNKIKPEAEFKGCEKLLASLRLLDKTELTKAKNELSKAKIIAAAYNLDHQEFELKETNDPDKYRIIFKTSHEVKSVNNSFLESKTLPETISIEDCADTNTLKLSQIETLFKNYKANNLKEGCFKYPEGKKDIVDDMLATITNTSMTEENRIILLRKKCLDNQAALQSTRRFPIHMLGYLLGIILLPVIIGIPIICTIWNRPVEGKKVLDNVQSKIGFRR